MDDGLTIIVIAAALYFLPALIAIVRGHHNMVPIFLFTLFFGWSVLGWLLAFIWSFSARNRANG